MNNDDCKTFLGFLWEDVLDSSKVSDKTWTSDRERVRNRLLSRRDTKGEENDKHGM